MEPLLVLPVVDGADLAAARRLELGVPRGVAAALGRSAVEAIERGWYLDAEGRRVAWGGLVEAAVEAKVSIPPGYELPPAAPRRFAQMRVQVCNETTLGASRRLREAGTRPLALNFANGLWPGGGFLHGARAQEEVLARSSALYATLRGDPMYRAHAPRALPDSTDWAILSPAVPVFRLDDGTPLPEPWLLDVVTCAAPYAPTVGRDVSAALLHRRIHRVLAIAAAFGYAVLVLGAWGCGAFGNDPRRTATSFRQALEGDFAGQFSDVVFAVTDWSPERRTLGPFRDAFAGDA